MDCFLYVYHINNLKLLKEEESKFNFISIAYLFNISTSSEDIGKTNLILDDNTIVDITNIFRNSNIDTILFERYLLELMDNMTNIHFSLESNYLKEFRGKFPYMFKEDEINYQYDLSVEKFPQKIVKQKTEVSPLTLYTYKNEKTITDLYGEGLAISLPKLLQEYESFLSISNIENIKTALTERKYIDLSTLIKTLKSRNDLIFHFEILIYKTIATNNAKFSIQDSLQKDITEMFPLLFINQESMDGYVNKEKEEHVNSEINVSQINFWVDKINEKLKGHTIFKHDFRQNLLKFSYLNRMNHRKILSILLCGESGIGKTEFAKIVSNVIYPQAMLTKINFGNYSTEGVLNSLIGSPLGYVGSEEEGELIKKLGSSKSKIILIDEFERATSSVHNFFYELLEDGKFTDRHGVEHDLNGYILIFTSNMTENQYQKHIPNSLKSRFDMVYNFEDIGIEDKKAFIYQTARKLIKNLRKEFDYEIELNILKDDLDKLIIYRNLREIKRKIEDVVFNEVLK